MGLSVMGIGSSCGAHLMSAWYTSSPLTTAVKVFLRGLELKVHSFATTASDVGISSWLRFVFWGFKHIGRYDSTEKAGSS